jgi:flagellar hook-associated protein 1 FlgK
MGIGNALTSAISGLRTSQAGIALVGQNVANADNPGYTRKTLTARTQVIGEQVVGVRSTQAQRTLDLLLQQTLRTETSGGTYSGVRARYAARLDALYGPPGSPAALDSVFGAFVGGLQALATSPEDPVARQRVLAEAQVLTQRISGLSEDIQSLRLETERGLGDAVARANDALSRIEALDRQVIAASAGGRTPVNLLDQRDQALGELANLMDIRVDIGPDNSVSVFTRSGLLLFDDKAVELEFDERSTMTPAGLYDPDPAKRAVGTITLKTPNGLSTDLVAARAFRSGEIAGLLSLRDGMLVDAQAQLDAFAAGLAQAMSDNVVAGAPVTVGAQAGFTIDVAGMQPGDVLTLDVVRNGVPAKVSIVRVEDPSKLPLAPSATADPSDEVIGVSFASPATAAAQLQAALPGFAVSATGTVIRFLDDGAPNTTDVAGLSGRFTETGLAGPGAAFAMFADAGSTPPAYTASLDGTGQRLGFAQRIVVNPALLADPSRLVRIAAGAGAGDPTRPNAMIDRLTKATRSFDPAGGIGSAEAPARATVASYLQRVVATQGQQAETEQRLSDGQEIVVNGLQERFDAGARVNVDEEMARLIELQQTFQASARIITAVDEMMKTLLTAI